MDPIWAPVIAALGSSALTALVAFGIDWRGARRQRDEQRRLERRDAYAKLLAITLTISQTAFALRTTIELRLGITEGIDVALRMRQPLDLLDLYYDRLRRDLVPLNEAWASVWTFGTTKAVKSANRLVDRAADVMGTATARGEARAGLVRLFLGEKWTPEQHERWKTAVRELALARKKFAEIARDELGSEVAELFLQPDNPDEATRPSSEVPS